MALTTANGAHRLPVLASPMEPPQRTVRGCAELVELLKMWEPAASGSAVGRLFVLFDDESADASAARVGAQLAALPSPSTRCLVVAGLRPADEPELAAMFPAVASLPALVRVGPLGGEAQCRLAVTDGELARFCASGGESSPLAEELAAYRRDGVCVIKNCLPPALVTEARAHVAWLAEQNPGRRPEHFDMMFGDPFWHRLVSDPILLDIAEHFVGPDIALFQTHWIAKPPGDGMPVLYHQDGKCSCSLWPSQSLLSKELLHLQVPTGRRSAAGAAGGIR